MSNQDLAFHDDQSYSWRHNNFPRLLLDAYKYFEAQIQQQIHEKGFPEIRSIHLGVMREMDIDGTRITVLADRAGVTKQAMSQLVKECGRLDLVTLAPDPSDGRAKIVYFSNKGHRFLETAKGVIQAIEREIIATLGANQAKSLRKSLKKIQHK